MSVDGTGYGVAVYKVDVRQEERNAEESGGTRGDVSGVEIEVSKWKEGVGSCLWLCQPPFRRLSQLGHPHQWNGPRPLRYTEEDPQLWKNQGSRGSATSRWRGRRSLQGARNPKVVEPGVIRRLLGSSPCPYPSSPLKMFHRKLERQSEEDGECMLQPDLRASVRVHQRTKMRKRTRMAIRRASATHC